MNEQKKAPKIERKLDRAVEATFPASDPVALGPSVTPPVADYSRRRPPPAKR